MNSRVQSIRCKMLKLKQLEGERTMVQCVCYLFPKFIEMQEMIMMRMRSVAELHVPPVLSISHYRGQALEQTIGQLI